jgi:hypothetical protein
MMFGPCQSPPSLQRLSPAKQIVANGSAPFLEKIEPSRDGDVTGQDVATALQIALVFRGRKTRELAKLVGQVRLVEEPTRLRELRPVDASTPLCERVEMSETKNTAE